MAELTVNFTGYSGLVKARDEKQWDVAPQAIYEPYLVMSSENAVLYLKPNSFQGGVQRITKATFQVYGNSFGPYSVPSALVSLGVMPEPFTLQSLQSGVPSVGNQYEMTFPYVDNPMSYELITVEMTDVDDIIRAINNGLAIRGINQNYNSINIPNPNQPGYTNIKVTTQSVVPEVWAYGPAGWIDVSKPTRFYWSFRYDPTNVMGELKQQSAVLRWKVGTNGQVTEIPLTTQTEYTFPANTFPRSSQIYWMVVVTGNNGESSSNMDWTNITAFDSIPTLTPVYPVGEYVEASKTVTFRWNYSIPTGTKQTSYEVQIQNDVGEWITVASGEDDSNSVTIDASVVPSGSSQWRVRGANYDGVFSEWSEPAAFVAISAPEAPIASVVSATPRPVIAWQSAGQQGYEAEIGDFKTGIVYGTSKQVKSDLYVPDGPVIARVRIVNEFGLWSDWSELAFTVSNDPIPGSISLNVQSGTDAVLSWTVAGAASSYLVYRNGKKIANVTGGSYTDRLHLGEAVYFVRAVQSDTDNYLDSNEASAFLSVDHTMISSLQGEWIDLEHSLTSLPSVQSTKSSAGYLMNYAGHTYPMPEFSPQLSRIYRINVAFSEKEKADTFDSLLGGLVIVKDQYGNFLVGLMESVQKAQNLFFTSYSAAISQVDEAAYENN